MSAEPITAAQAAAAASGSSIAGMASMGLPSDSIGGLAAIVSFAFAGAAAGLIVQPPTGTRTRMFALTFAFSVFGIAAALVLRELVPAFKGVSPAVSCLLAFFAQVLIPAARERLSREVRDRGAPSDKGDSR